MLKVGTFVACVTALCNSQTWHIPHGNELKQLVDNGFNLMDANKDGQLSHQEMEGIWLGEDMNHDGNLTLAEYAKYWNSTPEILGPIFNVWDKDGDGLVQANNLAQFGHLMDPNGDGIVTRHEYEHYMTGFLECVYGYGQHGHGANCDH